MAPEILENLGYQGDKADIFALGVVPFSLVTKSTPFQSVGSVPGGQTMIGHDKLYQLFCLNKNGYYGRYPMELSPEFRELIDARLNPNPLLRPSYSECISSSWMSSGIADEGEVRQELAERKAMKDGVSVDIPNISNRRSARNAVRRSGKVGNNTYVLGELTQEQRDAGNVISLALNSHDPSHKIPGSTYIYANMSAPDLFNWLNEVI